MENLNNTFTTTITINDVEQSVTLTQEQLDTLEALYYCQFNALRSHCITALWGMGLLWSDCNPSGVKLNFEGINWIEQYYGC